ncbi:MAG: hypothetical protein KGJ86_12750 [Chloroflexota bacterium]|nr:hypothetical protein [Chloroflexota bacterium]
MPQFRSQPYAVDVYSPGAVSPHRLTVTFTKRNGLEARVGAGETTFTTGPRSCTCVDFTLGDEVCLHMRAREHAFRRYARDRGLKVKEVARPIWAEDEAAPRQ